MKPPVGRPAASETGAPIVPSSSSARRWFPVLALWVVPFALVLVYAVIVHDFYHDEAHWTDAKYAGIVVTLLLITLAFSAVWFVVAFAASRTVGVFAPLGVLLLLARLPGLNRHVVITPPRRADTAREIWGRFGILFLVALGFELIYMITVFQRGDLAPRFAVSRPLPFFLEEFLAGLLLAVILAPAGPFLLSRVHLRITDSLEFPLLWLALLLVVVGGVSVLEVTVLPGFTLDTGLFLTSILLYAPAAWFVALAFSWEETVAQNFFLRQAWKRRSGRFHFGRLRVTDDPEGTTTDV